ncbi:MAG: peptidoglycan-binding domain-containing protein, partial [Pyrinomonadaceae bacterium]
PSGGKPGLKPGSRPTIRKGSSGAAVIEWQHVLGTNADGKFGPGTEGLTKSWQRQRNLKDDGVVGSATWGAATAKPGQATVKVAQVTDGTKKVTTVTKTSQPQQVKTADGKTKTVVKTTTVKTSEPAKKTTVASKTKEAISKVKESSIYGSIADAPWWQKLLGVSVIGGTAWYFGRNPEKHTTKYE